MVVQTVLSRVVPVSMFVPLGVLLFSTAGAVELTTAWDAETSRKTVFVTPDWTSRWSRGTTAIVLLLPLFQR